VNVASRVEVALSGLLGLLSLAGLVLPDSGHPYGHGDSGAFAFLAGASLAPVAIALAAAALALHRDMKPSWAYQCIPLAVIASIIGFFWWMK